MVKVMVNFKMDSDNKLKRENSWTFDGNEMKQSFY